MQSIFLPLRFASRQRRFRELAKPALASASGLIAERGERFRRPRSQQGGRPHSAFRRHFEEMRRATPAA